MVADCGIYEWIAFMCERAEGGGRAVSTRDRVWDGGACWSRREKNVQSGRLLLLALDDFDPVETLFAVHLGVRLALIAALLSWGRAEVVRADGFALLWTC